MRMSVPLASLATLLDLPAGVSVTAVDGTGGIAVLHLDGIDHAGHIDDADDEVSAEYLVDANGRRSFTRFAAPEAAPLEATEPEAPPAPVTELVGQAPAAPSKPVTTTKKAGS